MKQLALLAVALTCLCSSPAKPQSREFEVASIKPTKLGVGVRSACHGIDSKFAPRDLAAIVPLGRCVISSGLLSHMIGVAYNVNMDVLQGGPDWVRNSDNRFDLEAKAENPSNATEADLLMMLQTLLADRFKLKFHWETREIEGFEMIVAKNAPKFREASPDEEEKISLGAGGVLALANAKTIAVDRDKERVPLIPATLSAQKVSLARLAQLIQGFAGGHVEDRTNLKGLYDISLVWEAGQAISAPLQDQLGLKLERRRIPVRFFLIDYAERPSAN